MVSRNLKKKIIKNYYKLKFPGSFQSVKTFRESLKKNLNIDIKYATLRKILKSSLPFQVNVIKPKKFPTRANYSRGVYIGKFMKYLSILHSYLKKHFHHLYKSHLEPIINLLMQNYFMNHSQQNATQILYSSR